MSSMISIIPVHNDYMVDIKIPEKIGANLLFLINSASQPTSYDYIGSA
jgi:hypothetical protein